MELTSIHSRPTTGGPAFQARASEAATRPATTTGGDAPTTGGDGTGTDPVSTGGRRSDAVHVLREGDRPGASDAAPRVGHHDLRTAREAQSSAVASSGTTGGSSMRDLVHSVLRSVGINPGGPDRTGGTGDGGTTGGTGNTGTTGGTGNTGGTTGGTGNTGGTDGGGGGTTGGGPVDAEPVDAGASASNLRVASTTLTGAAPVAESAPTPGNTGGVPENETGGVPDDRTGGVPENTTGGGAAPELHPDEPIMDRPAPSDDTVPGAVETRTADLRGLTELLGGLRSRPGASLPNHLVAYQKLLANFHDLDRDARSGHVDRTG